MNTPHITPSLSSGEHTCRAFTLIELLTVIAIIAILAAILIPTLGRVRSSARMVECTSNLRALHRGFSLYSNDNKGAFPAVTGNVLASGGTGSWMLALQQGGYLDNKDQLLESGRQNVFLCPAAADTYTNGARRTYTMNSLLSGQANAIVVTRVTQPTRSLLVTDGKDSGAEGDAWLSFTEASYASRMDFRHNGIANTLFVDGHVAPVRADDPQLPAYVRNINP